MSIGLAIGRPRSVYCSDYTKTLPKLGKMTGASRCIYRLAIGWAMILKRCAWSIIVPESAAAAPS
jgi:hypothetical protein